MRLLIIILFFSLNASAQKAPYIDSVAYYQERFYSALDSGFYFKAALSGEVVSKAKLAAMIKAHDRYWTLIYSYQEHVRRLLNDTCWPASQPERYDDITRKWKATKKQ